MIRRFCALVAVLASCSCGGGAGTSISVSPTSVTFSADVGASPPPAQTVHVTYQGNGVIIGYPPEITRQPSWLAVIALGQTGSTADVSLQVSDTVTSGTRTTTLRFVTSNADATGVTFVDVPVTWTVNGAVSSSP